MTGTRPSLRSRLGSALDFVGLGTLVRSARQITRLAAESPAGRRNRVDDEHLELLLAFVLERGDNCIDVGAHAGTMLDAMVRYAPGGHHIAYEPLPVFAEKLAARYPAVDVRQAALSSSAGTRPFVFVETNPSYSGFRERTYPGVERLTRIDVRTERLDDALPPGYVPRLLKIDVEGAELEVFLGAIETIRRHQPVIIFEHGVGGADHYGTVPDDIYHLLVDDAGLRIFDMDGRGPLSRTDFRQSGALPYLCFNFVAHA